MIYIEKGRYDAVVMELAAVAETGADEEPLRLLSDARRCIGAWHEAGIRVALLGPGGEVEAIAQEEARIHCTSPASCVEILHRLGIPADRTALVAATEAGVRAGRQAGVASIVGVDRDGGDLRAAGADLVVPHLDALQTPLRPAGELPGPERCRERILEAKRPVFFLDFDGTLTPIVPHPDQAALDPKTREAVRALARRATVAVVSGRDRADVAERVGLPELYYAGSHGFDISGPEGTRHAHEAGREALPDLDAAEAELTERLADVEGALVERKRFSVAVHWRRVAPENVDRVRSVVGQVVAGRPHLRRSTGKMVAEIRPDVDWDKGRAVRWLLDALELEGERVLPVYLGDDVTDEDAFRALASGGVSILVGRPEHATAADCRLESPADVRPFLEDLAGALSAPG